MQITCLPKFFVGSILLLESKKLIILNAKSLYDGNIFKMHNNAVFSFHFCCLIMELWVSAPPASSPLSPSPFTHVIPFIIFSSFAYKKHSY